jgi:hypothetical protein
VRLSYLNKADAWTVAEFPGITDNDIQEIIDASTIASFGKGKETVTDKSYRDAYALKPGSFFSSFELCSTGVLGEIGRLLVPDVMNIRAELYKLTVYASPTGHFKAHVDTPRGGNMFGSLVVCLPTLFTGGTLVTRHNGQQVAYNWSSAADSSLRCIQWAAFFSDVEHEILPITRGHRVTLTYNLYHCSPVDGTVFPFYKSLAAAMNHPHFMRSGGKLGFACQHAYVFEEFDKCITWDEVVDRLEDPPMEKSTIVSKLRSVGAWFKPVDITTASKVSLLQSHLQSCYVEKFAERLSRAIKSAWLGRLLSMPDHSVQTNITWDSVQDELPQEYLPPMWLKKGC